MVAQHIDTGPPNRDDLRCDLTDCPRHLIPFESIQQRRAHRYATHGIRSEQPDSVDRRERRARAGIIAEVRDDLDGRNDIAERQAEKACALIRFASGEEQGDKKTGLVRFLRAPRKDDAPVIKPTGALSCLNRTLTGCRKRCRRLASRMSSAASFQLGA